MGRKKCQCKTEDTMNTSVPVKTGEQQYEIDVKIYSKISEEF